MSTFTEASDFPDSPNTRRSRSCSSASNSSLSSPKIKPGGSKSQRKSSSLPGETVEYLKAWMMSPEHVAHPYPTEQEKVAIMEDTGIELKQLTNWFVNNRKRYWKPRVEARLQQQAVTVATTAITTSQLIVANRVCEEKILLPQPVPQETAALSLSLDCIFAIAPTNVTSTTHEVTTNMHDPCATDKELESLATYIDSSTFPRTVSEASSSGSDCGNMSDSNSTSEESTVSEDSDQGCDTVCTETVDVHVLRPICFLDNADDKTPSIEDVSILPNVPAIRIIRSYRNIVMMYHYSKDIADDRKKVRTISNQSRLNSFGLNFRTSTDDQFH